MFLSNIPFSYNHSMNTYGNPISSIHEEININPAPFLEFSTPFLVNDDQDHFLLSDLSHLLSQQQQIQGSKSGEMVMDGHEVLATNVITISNTGPGKKRSCKRSTGKKDRHSKIYTAQGPRERRMRLSLPIARKFFDLQDMLGFDKASKTIEWLFSKSKAAIKDLTTCAAAAAATGGWSVSSTSESEVMSISKMSSTTQDGEVEEGDGESCGNDVVGEEIMKSKKVAKQGLLQTKESRDKARARARERTMEKMQIKLDLGFYSSQLMNEAPSHDGLLGHQMTSVNIMEKLLGTASTTSAPSSIFNCRTTNKIGISTSAGTKSKYVMIPENWDSIYNDSYYCALTNTKPSPGNDDDHHHQVQNPVGIFVTNPNFLPQNPNLNSPEQNPNSVLYPSFSEQNPAGYYPGLTSSEIVLHSDHQFLQQENDFSGNSNIPSKYGCLY